MNKIICPKCKELKLKSKVSEICSSQTCVAFFDDYSYDYNENGDRILSKSISPNDPNTYETYYQCSNGHNFKITLHRGKTDIIELGDSPYTLSIKSENS